MKNMHTDVRVGRDKAQKLVVDILHHSTLLLLKSMHPISGYQAEEPNCLILMTIMSNFPILTM